MKKKTIVISTVAVVLFAAGIALAASFAGHWTSNWGKLSLKQEETVVIGTYGGDYPGKLRGAVAGNKLSFMWKGDNGADTGKGYFILSADGKSFSGKWGSGDSDSNGGDWNGARVK